MNFNIFITWIFTTSFLGSVLPKDIRQIITYRLPQLNKKDLQVKNDSSVLPLFRVQDMISSSAVGKKSLTPLPHKERSIIILYQNREHPSRQPTNLQDWLPKFLGRTNAMLFIIPRKSSDQSTSSKNNETMEDISPNQRMGFSTMHPVPESMSSLNNESSEPITDSVPLSVDGGSKFLDIISNKNESDGQYTASVHHVSNVNEFLSKHIPSNPEQQILQKYGNESQNPIEILVSAARDLNVTSSPTTANENATETSLNVTNSQNSGINSSNSSVETSSDGDWNDNENKTAVKESIESLVSTVEGLRRINYHVTNFTYVADESVANKRISPKHLTAEETEFLPLTLFNPFSTLLRSQDESSSERRPGFGDYSDRPNHFFQASEVKKRRNDPLGSGNFEVVRGGIFKDEESSENRVNYDRTARGSHSRDYHDYNDHDYDSDGEFPFRLFDALSERRSVSVPPRRNNRLRFGGTQLIPTTADLVAMD